MRGALLGKVGGLGFKFTCVEDDDKKGANDGGLYLDLHCFDMYGGSLRVTTSSWLMQLLYGCLLIVTSNISLQRLWDSKS